MYVSGRVLLQLPDLLNDVIVPAAAGEEDVSTIALYVTARPSAPDNIPKAILDGSRGRPPQVLSARYVNPTFPFDFELTSCNLTPEDTAAKARTLSSAVDDDDDDDRGILWWGGDDLILSARLDTDGVALTRDSTDLVGRGIFRPMTRTTTTTTAQSSCSNYY